MLTWPCDHPGCTSRTMLKQGECMSCGKHLCGDHFSDTEHQCLGYDSDEGDIAQWEIDQADVSTSTIADVPFGNVQYRAYVTTKAEGFAAPPLLYECINHFIGGNIMTNEEEFLTECYKKHGRPDLADCVENGRIYQRLSLIGQWNSAFRKIGFREIFEPDLPADFDPPVDEVDWRVYMMERYKDHRGLQELMKKIDWSIGRAKEEAEKWHQEQEEKERRNEAEKEEQYRVQGIDEGDGGQTEEVENNAASDDTITSGDVAGEDSMEKELEKVNIEESRKEATKVEDKGNGVKEDADEEEKEKAEGYSGAT
ncbi:hypothetical protein I302_102421 [Kwoniella bestiolae CBS 10118]|uniref:AN1-type domain-containing protein n=1 Tax=Kwoniella bestiolae CBS 10118 TaxID=1296100 RepID=A0A1B9GEU4_9TREE|nr:hypothetical protein I302_01111 [Kwoniella bestiolae CBS 10118]OCF29602.1 hypothetical protein I302_01111 [Kwoniella bestiolae CBS 10118]